ncbi:MAG TPA: xanthine dehydrogenase family protein subunit M [Acidimicrobiales bacterium]|nr:xanthine dehydrogenase family protein subunit M [Acidimicrobiales bacterium]
MIPAPFGYVRATSSDEALAALASHGDEAKLLAGGHSLLPLMKLRLATPAVLVDVGRVPDLGYIRVEGDEVAIGALARHRDIERSAELRAACPVLGHVAGQVGDPQVRARGTLGGSLAHGDAASDLPAAVLALDGTLVVDGPRGRREVAAREFFVGFLETALEPDEMLVEVRVPVTGDAGWSYQKFTRRAQDWAVVGAVAVARGDGAAGALVNMGSRPLRADAVEQALADGATAADASGLAAAGTEPSADLHASTDYRRHLARVLTGRALVAAGVA